MSTFGQQVSFATFALQKVGTYQVEAEYLPNTNRFAESTSPPVTVTVTPLTAASFRVTPVVRHGHLGKPLSFTRHGPQCTETARDELHRHGRVLQPHGFLDDLPEIRLREPRHCSSRPLSPPGLATFNPRSYTFTPADQGSHTFVRRGHIRQRRSREYQGHPGQ